MSEIQNSTELNPGQLYSPDKIKQFLINIATYGTINEYPSDIQSKTTNKEINISEKKETNDESDYNFCLNSFILSNSYQVPILFNGWNYDYSRNDTISSITNYAIKMLSFKESFQKCIIIYCILLLVYILYM